MIGQGTEGTTRRRDKAPALVIGGAGFVGTNLARRLLAMGEPVRLLDNLSRRGVEGNAAGLRASFGDAVELVVADVRDRAALRQAVADATCVFHLASQVAVTTSLADPIHDFEVNLLGTLNLLEELRALSAPPPLVFTSTNKVYGDLTRVPLIATGSRYLPADSLLRRWGVDERFPLCFRSPYGCSKGGADQYVLDYARTFGLPAAVFRMSCIYGPHQLGTEDQGWLTHFSRSALDGAEVVIYGDGKQVRDVLFVEDLVDALLLARTHIESLSGEAFNIGGGPSNTISLLELLDLIERLCGERPATRFERWRPGDQRYYVSDPRKFCRATGWRAKVGVEQGTAALLSWLGLRQPGTGTPHVEGERVRAKHG